MHQETIATVIKILITGMLVPALVVLIMFLAIKAYVKLVDNKGS